MTKRKFFAPACALWFLFAGCRRAPEFNILGSYFPGWILCIVLGILLTVAVRVILYRLRLERQIPLLPLVYTCLVIIFASTLWLLIFE